MARYTVTENTGRAKEILLENDERVRRIHGNHDQLTGRGMESHVHKVTIDDYPIKTQWLTDEVFRNGLYQAVMREGSVKAYVDKFNLMHRNEIDAPLTYDDTVRELMIARLSRDPSFAFIVCYKIKPKEGGEPVPFRLNYAQRVLLAEMEGMRVAGTPIRIILLKARQWGGSTLVQLYISWVQIFVKTGWNSVIIAQTKDTSKRIKGMYAKVLENFPTHAVFGVGSLQFSPNEGSSSDSVITTGSGEKFRDNVSTIASYENFEATRGMDYAMAHFSEVAYWVTTPSKSAEGVIRNIDSNILEAPLTIEISESTANGMSGYFYDEYQLAKSGKSSRKAIFIPFFFIENDMKPFGSAREKREFVERMLADRESEKEDETHECGKYLYGLWMKGATLEHINWYVQKRASFHDHAQMASEAPSDDIECFKYSGHPVFDSYKIDELKEKYACAPIFTGDIQQSEGGEIRLRPDMNGELFIWQHPNTVDTEHEYLVVVDVGGRSKDSDYSVITVIRRWARRFGGYDEAVARWRGHLRYDFMAYKAVKIARYYKNALLCFESNTFDKKKSEANEFVEQGDHIRGILKMVQGIYDNLYMRAATSEEDLKQGIYTKIGFQTNVKTKQEMVDNFQVAFEEGMFIDHDERFYKEASIYEQRPDGSYGNIFGKGNHDDIVMTDMIGALVSDKMETPALRKEVSEGFRRMNQGTRNESDV